MFFRLVAKLCETDNFNPQQRDRCRTCIDEAAEVAVLAAVAVNPYVSTRQLEAEIVIPKTSAHRILMRQTLHPYHAHLNLELLENNVQNSVEFCQWAQNELIPNSNFFSDVLFTDESSFSNSGQLNTKNMHYWAVENPQWPRQVDHRRQWRVNVSFGMVYNGVIGLNFLNGNQSCREYATFIQIILLGLLEEIHLSKGMIMWYQYDGCPVYNAVNARRILNRKYSGRWIDRGGPVQCSVWSPELNPLDFFLWCYLKAAVYRDMPTTPENMQELIKACL